MAVVDASFQFLQWQPPYSQEKPYEVFLPAESFQNKISRSNLVFEPHSVRVHDVKARANANETSSNQSKQFKWAKNWLK